LVQDNFTNTLKRKNRGVHQAGFVVLHQTVMPSILVETGFITNKKEGAFLNSKSGQKKIAKSISDAILKYKNSLYQDEDSLLIEDSVTVEDTTPAEVLDFKNIVFKVQIAASRKALAPKPYNFKGLKNITRIKNGNLYKYLYGNTSNYDDVKKLKAQAEAKGYKSCFIVAYKNGNKISLQEALKSESN
jgi:N-acetylmuramoyl-L-alanine amidase